MSRLTEARWINLFLRQVGTLEPALELVNAMRFGMKSYGNAPDSKPEDAAEAYVTESTSGRWSRHVTQSAGGVQRTIG